MGGSAFLFFSLIFLLLSFVSARNTIDFDALFDEVKPDPNDPNLSIASILAARQATPSPIPAVCLTKTKKSVFVFGKCPDRCRRTLLKVFAECGPRIQSGCDLVPCSGGRFRCQLKPELVRDKTICPGDKVIFNRINIKRMENFSYGIDLLVNPLQTDLYILFDGSGSMRSTIQAAKDNADKILRIFGRRPNVAFGIGFYRDENDFGPLAGFRNVRKITPITNNRGNRIAFGVTLIRNAIFGLIATGGRDRDEANLIALYKLATDPSIGWRTRSRKITQLLPPFKPFEGHFIAISIYRTTNELLCY